MKLNLVRISLVLMTLVGTFQIGQGIYLYVKAELAQYLLITAWEESRATKQKVKPWAWADTWPVARLRYARGNVDIIVLAGDSGRNLAFGPGYQFGTAMPGESGNSIISAHRDTHFGFLAYLEAGDQLQLQSMSNENINLRVVETAVIDSRKTSIRIDTEDSLVTLLTCYPFDSIETGGPLRYMVLLKVLESDESISPNLEKRYRL